MTQDAGNRKLVAAVACRNQGSRLYGKPVQNLDVEKGIRIIDNILGCLDSLPCIEQTVLGIAEGIENDMFIEIAKAANVDYVVGDESDVLARLIQCGEKGQATDVFRITSESPFLFFEQVADIWKQHIAESAHASFMDNIIDGCGFEIITLDALKVSHARGDHRHRSELCSLYLREHADEFRILRPEPPASLVRWDLRLTVDNPEDLVACRQAYKALEQFAPRIPIVRIVEFLDSRPDLIKLMAPFTEHGYSSMNL